MRSHLSVLFTLPLVVAACGNAGVPHPSTLDIAEAKPAKKTIVADDDMPFIEEFPGAEGQPAGTPTQFANKLVGDRTVHRFSGTFSKTSLILTQEVTARGGSLVVVDYTLEDGDGAIKLRVTHDIGTERVLRVREIRGKRELPSSVAAFDKLMARTSFAPDDNEAEIAKQKTTCLVGDQQLDCEKIDYRVKIGDETAIFSIARSSDGRDVSGEISDASGKIIYKSELIEARSGLPANVASR